MLFQYYFQQVLTQSGLYVRWDGDSRVEVRIVADFKNKTCGLCGNYNGDGTKEDEFITPDGSYVSCFVSSNEEQYTL